MTYVLYWRCSDGSIRQKNKSTIWEMIVEDINNGIESGVDEQFVEVLNEDDEVIFCRRVN